MIAGMIESRENDCECEVRQCVVIAGVNRGMKTATDDTYEGGEWLYEENSRHLRAKCGMRDRGCKQSGAEGLIYLSMPMR
jgi:hypothetical protein